jgi:hypothetical protein
MARRRSRPGRGVVPRVVPDRVPAGGAGLAPVSADLLPTTTGRRRTGVTTVAPAAEPEVPRPPRTADERAARIRAMARAASRRASTRRA